MREDFANIMWLPIFVFPQTQYLHSADPETPDYTFEEKNLSHPPSPPPNARL